MDYQIRPLSQKWFKESLPVNYETGLSTTIGAGANGVITIKDKTKTSLKIVVSVAETGSAALAATYADGTISIVLGTDATPAADATKNTAVLITAAINGITSKTWTATYSGDGSTAIGEAIASKDFEVYVIDGTPCPESGLALYDNINDTYYVCVEAKNTTTNNGWRTFTLNAY